LFKIDDFIGVFPNAMEDSYCDSLVDFFEYKSKSSETFNRQARGYSTIQKETEVCYMDEPLPLHDVCEKCDGFTKPVWDCYYQYAEKYGILSTLSRHRILDIKLQKTRPKQGYHVWHCENGSPLTTRRLLLAIGYLNDVEEGGETEFLYQGVRIKPTKGTIILCPAAFTHTHRGNPPLSGDKYIINTWIQYIETEDMIVP
jgi:hypothetical protein